MFSRIIKNLTAHGKNETTSQAEKSKFDELEQKFEQIDTQAMNHIEGGRKESQHLRLNELLDITSMPGGGTPS